MAVAVAVPTSAMTLVASVGLGARGESDDRRIAEVPCRIEVRLWFQGLVSLSTQEFEHRGKRITREKRDGIYLEAGPAPHLLGRGWMRRGALHSGGKGVEEV